MVMFIAIVYTQIKSETWTGPKNEPRETRYFARGYRVFLCTPALTSVKLWEQIPGCDKFWAGGGIGRSRGRKNITIFTVRLFIYCCLTQRFKLGGSGKPCEQGNSTPITRPSQYFVLSSSWQGEYVPSPNDQYIFGGTISNYLFSRDFRLSSSNQLPTLTAGTQL